MGVFDDFQNFVKQNGVCLQGCGVLDFGLPAALAIEAIEILQGSSVAVVGGDVYALDGGSPVRSYDSWHAPDRQLVDVDRFEEVSHEAAKDYMRNYRERNGDNFLYTLVLANA